jgi:hypothetical protein
VDFFERYLGISPDHGDGSLEALFVVVLFMMIVVLALRVGKTKQDWRKK